MELLSCCHHVYAALHNEGRTGQFSFGSEVLPVNLLNLPCVVESYKTYDDSHLVKMCDVGQVPSEPCCSSIYTHSCLPHTVLTKLQII